MKDKIISKVKYALRTVMSPLRAFLVRNLKPKSAYFLFPTDQKRSFAPLSRRSGFDRGTPVDRYYIEQFLDENKDTIRGRCLEIHDNAYTVRYGDGRVSRGDVLDIETSNGLANIYGDLRNLGGVIADNTYDTIILTHTIGMIDDVWAVIKECHRILKPGGKVLLTASAGVKGHRHPEQSFWRFGVGSARFLFGKNFSRENVTVKTYGNILACQAFLVGVAKEELTEKELSYNDPHYPLIITVIAKK